MNTNFVSTRVVKAFSIVAAAVVLFVSNPLTSSANEGHPNKKAGLTDAQVTVQYVGAKDDNVVFRVEFENPTTDKFWLIIKNDAGEVVYHKQFSDAHFSKTVYFQKDEAEIHPSFIIRDSNNNEIVRQFSVNTTVVENTTVTRL